MARIKSIDLMQLGSDDPLWDTLLSMTLNVSSYYTHAARHMLKRLRRQIAENERPKKLNGKPERRLFSQAEAVLLVENGEVMAHNIIMKERRHFHRILHAFTKHKFRKLGCQKRLLKYTSKKYHSLYFWTNNKARERTFAYYKGTRMLD